MGGIALCSQCDESHSLQHCSEFTKPSDSFPTTYRSSCSSKCVFTNLPVSFSVAFAAFKHPSPSTSTHQPSPPLPPSPPTPALNSRFAYSSPSSSKLPGCNHTAGTPASLASRRTCFVIAGCVTMLSEVSVGWGSADGEGMVG